MSASATTNVPARRRRGCRLVAATLLATAATIGTLLFDPTPALAKPKQPPSGVTCARQEGGEWNFYLPGERVYGTYGELIECGTDGLWHAVRA